MANEIEIRRDEWRGASFGDGGSEDVEVVAQAYADYILANVDGPHKVLVSHDGNCNSVEAAWGIARILFNNGITVDIVRHPGSAFAVSFYIREKGYSGGVVVDEDVREKRIRIRFRAPYGGPIDSEITRKLNYYMRINKIRRKPIGGGEINEIVNIFPDYLRRLESLIDFGTVARLSGTVVLDLKGGVCTDESIKSFFRQVGVEVDFINDTSGVKVRRWETYGVGLTELVGEVRRRKAKLGVAIDPSGCFIGIVDEEGNIVDGEIISCLLYGYIAKVRMNPVDVVKTVSVSDLIRQVAKKFNRRVYEAPLVDQCVVEKMQESEAGFAFDDKGGIIVRDNVYDKDGIVSTLLVMEMMGYYNLRLSDMVQELFMKYGRYFFRRAEKKVPPDLVDRVVSKLRNTPPVSIGDLRVNSTLLLDGVKFYFDNQSWLLVKHSNYPGIVEICSGGQDEEVVCKLLDYGKRIFEEYEIVKFHIPVRNVFY